MLRFTAVAALVVAAAAVLACAPDRGGPIELALESPTLATAAGLSRAELASIPESQLPNIFQVSVAGSNIPIAGRHSIANGRIEFAPAFPFDADKSYTLDFRPGDVSGRVGQAPISRTTALRGAPHLYPATSVLSVDPTALVWPANLLRVYIHFSAPMSRESGLGRITLRGSDGVEVTDAFLPLEADFWSPDHRRYTVFFDPGRVKRGILPNRQRGRALVDGHRYVLEISAEWRDAHGKPLAEAFKHSFVAGPAIEQPISVDDWKLTRPSGHTRGPLVITFPWPIDRGIAERAFIIQTRSGQAIAGRGELAPGDLSWAFTPDASWAPGDYQLTALPILEDPSGNQIGRAFETDMKDVTAMKSSPADARRTIAFKVS